MITNLLYRASSGKAKARAFTSGSADFVHEPARGVRCTHTVIVLPGVSSHAHGSWRDDVVRALAPKCPTARFIVHAAPLAHVDALPRGMGKVPAHYNVYGTDYFGKQDVSGIAKALDRVAELVRIEVEERNVPPSNIIIGGFSQGGSLALAYALLARRATGPQSRRRHYAVGAVFGMRAFLPLARAALRDSGDSDGDDARGSGLVVACPPLCDARVRMLSRGAGVWLSSSPLDNIVAENAVAVTEAVIKHACLRSHHVPSAKEAMSVLADIALLELDEEEDDDNREGTAVVVADRSSAGSGASVVRVSTGGKSHNARAQDVAALANWLSNATSGRKRHVEDGVLGGEQDEARRTTTTTTAFDDDDDDDDDGPDISEWQMYDARTHAALGTARSLQEKGSELYQRVEDAAAYLRRALWGHELELESGRTMTHVKADAESIVLDTGRARAYALCRCWMRSVIDIGEESALRMFLLISLFFCMDFVRVWVTSSFNFSRTFDACAGRLLAACRLTANAITRLSTKSTLLHYVAGNLSPRSHSVVPLLLKWGASTAAIDVNGHTPHEIVLTRLSTRIERGDPRYVVARDAHLCAKLIVAGAIVPTLEALQEAMKLSQRVSSMNAVVSSIMCKWAAAGPRYRSVIFSFFLSFFFCVLV